MADLKLKKGDIVAYRTKDQHGFQHIFARVEGQREDGEVELTTLPDNTPLLIKRKVLTKVKTVWQDTMREVRQHPDPNNEHYTCLQTVSIILNRYQDIEDVLSDSDLSFKQKLKRIKKINAEIGETVSKYLPE